MPSIDDQDVVARRSGSPATPAASSQNLLWWLTLGYSAFVIYGSLVPLQFHPRPLDEAWEHFQRIPYLELSIGSRADWVANILLFVPLAFLWLGVLWPNRGWIAKALASGFVLSGCVGLSVAIEFTQIFFPPRTVSLNDIIAESIGAVIGTVLWWSTGGRVMRWLAGWFEAHTPTGTAERLLYAYLFLLFGYSVLPLDLTISFIEIYHKWQEGKVLLVPFSAVYETGAQRAYALLADIVIWIPAAFLWKLSSPRPARKIVLYVLACATTIEVLQLFVYSRVTSTTDVLMAGCGGAIGVALARWLRPSTGNQGSPRAINFGGAYFALLWILAFAGWAGVLIVVFWYPFDFSTDWGFVHGRLAALKRVPFEAYYFGTEFRAVTEVFHKTGFFFPLGALLAVGAAGIRRRLAVPAILLHAASALVVACAAAGIEIGQLFLPGKVADTTDWFLETFGGLVGYFCLRILIPLWQSGRGNAMPQQASGRQR
jgi:glycopeptide antibiotics resistance protein